MTAENQPDPGSEEFWRDFLTRGHRLERVGRRVFRHIPHEPRCSMCAAPFAGVGAPLMRLIGKRPSSKTPSMCASCFTFLSRHHGGAEIECTMLFAEILATYRKVVEAHSLGRFDRPDR